MRKGILLAEYFRTREMYDVLNRDCPVCDASTVLKSRFDGEKCASDYRSACHPKVQSRCDNIMALSSNLEEKLADAVYTIRQVLEIKYGLYRMELNELYEEWLKGRNKND